MATPSYRLTKRPPLAKAAVTVDARRLVSIIAELDLAVQMGVEEAARDIAEDARRRAPDATPLGVGLKAAIHTVTRPEGTWVIAGDEDTTYGHFVEFGTNQMAAHPFMIPALEARRQEGIARVQLALKGLAAGKGFTKASQELTT